MLKILSILTICLLAAMAVNARQSSEQLSQLRVDYAALLVAQKEYQQLANNGHTSADELQDYADWIGQLSDQFADGCRRLGAAPAIPADLPCAEYTATHRAAAGIDLQAEATEAEKIAGMVRQLQGSIGEFDEKLLREQDRVKQQRPQTESSQAGQSGASQGENAGENRSNGSQGEGAQGETGEQQSSASSDGHEAGQPGSESASNSGSRPDNSGQPGRQSPGQNQGQPGPAPADVPDGRDDDVIARQLREAAEKETDPELKRKLWDEYKRYKSGN